LRKHTKRPYLESVNYDVTQAKFYDQFNDSTLRPEATDKMINIKLKKEELDIFRKKGFIVRAPSKKFSNFSDEYLSIYENDLPVFVTTDSILLALSTSYDHIMSSLERNYFSQTLQGLIQGMLANLRPLHDELDESGPLRECCKVLFSLASSFIFCQNSR